MKKYIYFLFFFIFIPIQIICSDDSLTNIYYSVSFDSDIRINGKTVIQDLSSDILKYIKRFDSTSDIPQSSRIIYKNNEIEKFRNTENLIKELLFEKINLKNKTFNIILIQKNDDIANLKGIYFDIKVTDYTEGEYNLIKNRNTIIKLLVKIYKKDFKTGLFLLERWYYFCKPDINFPTERIRLDYLIDKITENFLLKIKKIF